MFPCSVSAVRWLQTHFAVSAKFDCDRWSCKVTQPVRCTPAFCLPALDKSRGSKSVDDDRLRFMSRSACDGLTRSLLDGDVSSAWARLAEAQTQPAALDTAVGSMEVKTAKMAGHCAKKLAVATSEDSGQQRRPIHVDDYDNTVFEGEAPGSVSDDPMGQTVRSEQQTLICYSK